MAKRGRRKKTNYGDVLTKIFLSGAGVLGGAILQNQLEAKVPELPQKAIAPLVGLGGGALIMFSGNETLENIGFGLAGAGASMAVNEFFPEVTGGYADTETLAPEAVTGYPWGKRFLTHNADAGGMNGFQDNYHPDVMNGFQDNYHPDVMNGFSEKNLFDSANEFY